MENLLGPIELQEYPPISREVYRILRENILNAKLPQGLKLVERDIARQLGVSRTPVREAIRKLEQEGLVRHIPRKGVIVSNISERDIQDIYAIRAVLEGLAARLAAERISPKKLNRLNEIITEMKKALEQKDEKTLQVLHLEFNNIIYEAAECPRLYQMINLLVDYIAAFTKIGYSVPGRMQAATEEHENLVKAIAEGDFVLAEEIARKHIEKSREAYFLKKNQGVSKI